MQLDLSYLSVILQSIVVAVVIVLAVAVWRWLRVALERNQIGAQNDALAQIATYAAAFVAAADMTMSKQPGFAKLNWVLEQLDDVLPDVDKNLIRSIVESAVLELRRSSPPATGTAGYVATPTPSASQVELKWVGPLPQAGADTVTTASTTPPPATSHSHRNAKSKAGTDGL